MLRRFALQHDIFMGEPRRIEPEGSLEHVGDAIEQGEGTERLGEVAVGAHSGASLAVGLLRTRGQHDDLDPGGRGVLL